MRIIFHNPHETNLYKTPISFFLEKRISVQKYTHLLDYFIERKDKIYFFIDSYNLDSKSGIKKIFPNIGFFIWLVLNKVNPFRVEVITDHLELRKEDILFFFHINNFTNQQGSLSKKRIDLNKKFIEILSFKVCHITHYNYSIKYGSSNLLNAKVDLLVAENNLFKNSCFFKTYYKWYNKNVLVLPFVPKDKFQNITNFSTRINKAIATGTITLNMDNDFYEYFSHTNLHPIRKEIYENKNLLTDIIDSFISPIIEDKLSDTHKQSNYFSFDIVEKYNQYKMFIVPEEISDLPAIGFVEGMACGCAYIAKVDNMYEDIGLINGVHYIGYDGTLVDLSSKIKYYQENLIELEFIAKNGNLFVNTKLTRELVCKNFINKIKELNLERLITLS